MNGQGVEFEPERLGLKSLLNRDSFWVILVQSLPLSLRGQGEVRNLLSSWRSLRLNLEHSACKGNALTLCFLLGLFERKLLLLILEKRSDLLKAI